MLLPSAPEPLAVFLEPPWFLARALWPNAVLSEPVVTAWRASVSEPGVEGASQDPDITEMVDCPAPPAVLACASLPVGFKGWPQLGVMCSIRTSPATTATRRMSRFIESSMRRAARRGIGGGATKYRERSREGTSGQAGSSSAHARA